MLIGCLIFTAIGVGALIQSLDSRHRSDSVFEEVMPYLAIAFFGVVGVPLSIWRLLSPPLPIRVDTTGVRIERDLLEWNEIERVCSYRTSVQLMITAMAYESRSREQSIWRNLLQMLNTRLAGGPSLFLPSTLKAVRRADLERWLSTLHEHYAGNSK